MFETYEVNLSEDTLGILQDAVDLFIELGEYEND